MVVHLLRSSRFFRSLVLTTWVFSVLLWLYIVARIIVNQVDVHMPFVDSVPSLSFSAMGAFAFGLSFLSMFIYLWLWGRFDRRSPPPWGSFTYGFIAGSVLVLNSPWLENTGPSDAQREPGMPRGAKVNTAPHIRDL